MAYVLMAFEFGQIWNCLRRRHCHFACSACPIENPLGWQVKTPDLAPALGISSFFLFLSKGFTAGQINAWPESCLIRFPN